MTTVTINRGDVISIPFTITDAANGLAGKRVTWALAAVAGAPIRTKASGLAASSADVTISSQSAGSISGTINMSADDYTALPDEMYLATLWVDDGSTTTRVTTDGGTDVLNITPVVNRT